MTHTSHRKPGVSFVVPVRNGAPWLRAVLDAIWCQDDGRPLEVIAVHDGSNDGSGAILAEMAARHSRLRMIDGDGRGAAACINVGIRAARFSIICQVDQDVILGPDWLRLVTAHLEDPRVAAVQGCYTNDPGEAVIARVMALDLAQRYAAMRDDISHVCTGNTAYKADALHRVGLFDEHLGYGYDNDMSYRLQDAGYRLLFCRDARSFHRWRDTLGGYCSQQYGFGYGRLEIVAKHPRRITGDSVSPLPMMLHPLLALGAVTSLLGAAATMWMGYSSRSLILVALTLLTLLAVERSVAAVRGLRAWNDRAALLFPVLHLVRDVVWSSAIVAWCARRTLGLRGQPSHSMAPRRHPAHVSRAIDLGAGAKASRRVIARAADHGAQT